LTKKLTLAALEGKYEHLLYSKFMLLGIKCLQLIHNFGFVASIEIGGVRMEKKKKKFHFIYKGYEHLFIPI
jgi:hypothetical protein